MIYKRDMTAMAVPLIEFNYSIDRAEALSLLRAVYLNLPNTGFETAFLTTLAGLAEYNSVDLQNFRTFTNPDCIDYIENFPYDPGVIPARDDVSIGTVSAEIGHPLTQAEVVALRIKSAPPLFDPDAIHPEYHQYSYQHPENKYNNLRMFIDPDWWGETS